MLTPVDQTSRTGNTGLFGDIFETEIPPVDIEFVVYNIPAEIDIGQPVPVKITQSDSGTVVKIPVGIGIVFFAVVHLVAETGSRSVLRPAVETAVG